MPGHIPEGSVAMPLQGKQPVDFVGTASPLIRRQALAAGREPLHGAVTVAMPPGSAVAAAAALVTVLSLALAAWLVEVPQRARAVGILMPPDGFVRVVAPAAGRVSELHVRDGQRVARGQSLVRVISDGGAVNADSVPYARLQSLRAELRLREDLARAERAASERRARALDLQIERSTEELDGANAEAALQDARVELLTRRLERMRSLAVVGNVAGTQLDDARLAWLAGRAAVEGLRRQSSRIGQEREQLRDARKALAQEAVREEIEQAISREQIARALAEVEAQAGRELRAPRAGIVARVTVTPGQAVRAGQTLATLHHGAGRLEAWLYLPSTQAGALGEGQAVELRFDAWPSHVFGTRQATIASVSSIALMPSELDVPLSLSGPVFEIRATLESQSMTVNGRRWPLAAGTAVRAEVVQQRYRLYQWLLRVDRPQPASPADA